MAQTAQGQMVMQKWAKIEEKLFAVGVLNEIMFDQLEHIRLQNIGQMQAGKNRNGLGLGRYSKSYAKGPSRQGKKTGTVDLYVTGEFYRGITSKVGKNRIDKKGFAELNGELRVAPEHEGRLRGFRTGKYGKHGKAIKRPVVGMADKGTPLRTAQEKQLERIAKQRYAKELRAVGITFNTKDI